MSIEELIERLKAQQKVRPNVQVYVTNWKWRYEIKDFHYYFGDLNIEVAKPKGRAE